jgi:hypothetical protein
MVLLNLYHIVHSNIKQFNMKSAFFVIACIISFSATAQPWCRTPGLESGRTAYGMVNVLTTSRSTVDFQIGIMKSLPSERLFSAWGVTVGLKELRNLRPDAKEGEEAGEFIPVVTYLTVLPIKGTVFTAPHLSIGFMGGNGVANRRTYWEAGTKVVMATNSRIAIMGTVAWTTVGFDGGIGISIGF